MSAFTDFDTEEQIASEIERMLRVHFPKQPEDAPQRDPFVRGILEVIADPEWKPDDLVADGGITALDVVRKDAQAALKFCPTVQANGHTCAIPDCDRG
jgi:hypothetical protein